MNKLLVTLADKYDREGRFDLANKIDELLVEAKNTPLKKLDEKVQQNLKKFVSSVVEHMTKAKDDLEELERRLRYFKMDGLFADLGFDKALKEMGKACDKVEEAKKGFAENLKGGRVSKEDLREMFGEEMDARDPMEFFGDKEDEEEVGDDELEDFWGE